MSLSDRFKKGPELPDSSHKSTADNSQKALFQTAKFKLHQKLVERLNLEALSLLPHDEAKEQVASLVKKLVAEEKIALSSNLQQQLIRDIINETFGLGPLEPLLEKSSVDEILVNGPHQVYIEQHGKLELTNVVFKDDSHLRHVINRIAAGVGRRIDEGSPMVDARLPDGSRVNAIIPPLSLNGPILSIRRFKATPLTIKDLVKHGSMDEKISELLNLAVSNKLNILISGGTGSGKTTLLNVVSRFIPHDERIITIEDAAELQLQQPHVVRLETRPANTEGRGQIAQRDLLRNALRMRPDRIIIGEVRGEEALDMLQAMNTGHEGSLTTVHANTERDALSRIETMVLMANSNLTNTAITRQIASALHLIIQIKRFSDGSRRIASISEVSGMEGQVITLQEVMSYHEKGFDGNGKLIGSFIFAPVKPKFLNKINSRRF